MDYRNKVILVTGASSGIGRATAIALGKYNNQIAITARRQQLLREVSQEISHAGSESVDFVGDATESAHGAFVVQETVKRFGRIDLAILNVGMGLPSNTVTASCETILYCMRANYDSMINFFVPLISQMKKQASRSMISHMNSLASYFGIPMQGDYTAAKAAARIFIETARMELRHFSINHIKLQTIHPGFVATEAVKNSGQPTPYEISEDEAVRYILEGINSEVNENYFPPGLALATRFGRISPLWLRRRVLLGTVPKEY